VVDTDTVGSVSSARDDDFLDLPCFPSPLVRFLFLRLRHVESCVDVEDDEERSSPVDADDVVCDDDDHDDDDDDEEADEDDESSSSSSSFFLLRPLTPLLSPRFRFPFAGYDDSEEDEDDESLSSSLFFDDRRFFLLPALEDDRWCFSFVNVFL
jgi:hypothetical protein